jgi:class 3 adenylate cyclase
MACVPPKDRKCSWKLFLDGEGTPNYVATVYVGRADYFGHLPNMAARVMALAAPGQILVDAAGLIRGGDGVVRLPPCPAGIPQPDEPIELEVLGAFQLRVRTPPVA